MKIAVTYEDGQIFQHFGHTEHFKIYEVKNSSVEGSEVIDTNGSGHGALATLLKEKGVEVLICGGIGGGAKTALSEAGIKLYGGVVGCADDAVSAFIENNLVFNPNVKCTHHDNAGSEHSCGNHGCGEHHC